MPLRFWLPYTHRQLAVVWLWLSGLGFVVGMALALLIRAELAYPGIQLIAPAYYSAIVLAHGMVLPVFAMTPFAIVALPLLTMMGGGAQHTHQTNVLSTWAVRLFALAILVSICGFAAMFFQPAADEGAGWIVDSDQQVYSSSSVAAAVLILGSVIAYVSTAFAALGLAWSIGSELKAEAFRSPASIAFFVAAVFSICAIGLELFDLLPNFLPAPGMGQTEVLAEGVGQAALTSALAITPMATAMMLAAVAILHGAVEMVSGRPLVARPVALAMTIAFAVACLLQTAVLTMIVTAWVQQLVWSVGTGLLLSMSVLWILTLLKARPFAWPVAFAIVGFVGALSCTIFIFNRQSINVALSDTYYVVALHHAWGQIAFVLVVFAALYASFPMSWRGSVGTFLASVQLALFAIGSLLTFAPQFLLGLQGMPRGYADYPESFAYWNLLSSAGSFITAVSFLLFAMLMWRGRRAQ